MRKPASDIFFGNFCVLLADLLRKTGIRFATEKQTPRITSARNHLANIEAGIRDEEDAWRLI